MSCYLRHLSGILDEAGISLTRDNRREVDQAIHKIVGVTYKDCPAAWKRVKEKVMSDPKERLAFIERLRGAMS